MRELLERLDKCAGRFTNARSAAEAEANEVMIEAAVAISLLLTENDGLIRLVECTECSAQPILGATNGWMPGLCPGCQAEAQS